MVIRDFIKRKDNDDLIGCLELTEDYLVHCTYPPSHEVQYLIELYEEAKIRKPDYVSPNEHRHCFFD